MKKIFLLLPLLLFAFTPSTLAAVNNGGLSGGCNVITDCGVDDFYAGKCNTHIEVLNDCAAIVGPGSNQLSFSCVQGCVGSCLPGYIKCGGVCVLPQADDGINDGNNDGKSCSAVSLTFNQCTGQCGSCAAGFELIKGVCMNLATVESRLSIVEIFAPKLLDFLENELSQLGAGVSGTNVIKALRAMIDADGATNADIVNFTTTLTNLLLSGGGNSIQCKDGEIAMADGASAGGWKCITPADPVKMDALQGVVTGIINVLQSIMTQLGAKDVLDIITILNNLFAATDPDQIIQLQKDLSSELKNFSIFLPSGGGIGSYVGKSVVAKKGNAGSYNLANNECSLGAGALAGSHVCSADEIIRSYNDPANAINPEAESLWFNNGPPGYIINVSNDCKGWNSISSTVFGSVWNATQKASYITSCDLSRKYACCK